MGRKPLDLVGKDFGSLHVIRRKEITPDGRVMWLCRCNACGSTCVVQGRHLRDGKTQSCGCLGRKHQRKKPADPGSSHGGKAATSLSRIEITEDPYRRLADAIICMAADDYRKALKTGDDGMRKEVEKFFGSSWYSMLSGVDSSAITNPIRREILGETSEE